MAQSAFPDFSGSLTNRRKFEITMAQNRRNRGSAKPAYDWGFPAVCLALGPPLGLFFLMCVIGWSIDGSHTSGLLITLMFFPLAVPFSYIYGGLPALLVGVLIMILNLQRNWLGICIMVILGTLSTTLVCFFSLSATGDDIWIFIKCGVAVSLVLSAFLPRPR
ncbi:hypothetical protein [Eikenella longinqua]|uniref:hypothetical protein n=1 Tax=Eikenella longinqua TaxID=1795827 RepID=UPI0012E737A5|nr:hypothetical protein [Eikenella longinqua]